jgi:hypothetical protein
MDEIQGKPFHEWTPCEVHGHRYSFESTDPVVRKVVEQKYGPPEVYDTCIDCGEPR